MNILTQGCRKHQKVGGGEATPISRGTFGMKRVPKKIFQEMLATGERGRKGRKNKRNHKSKAVKADSRVRSNESDRKN
jgi:hypothetical protein